MNELPRSMHSREGGEGKITWIYFSHILDYYYVSLLILHFNKAKQMQNICKRQFILRDRTHRPRPLLSVAMVAVHSTAIGEKKVNTIYDTEIHMASDL